jgi:hypothetical protein
MDTGRKKIGVAKANAGLNRIMFFANEIVSVGVGKRA